MRAVTSPKKPEPDDGIPTSSIIELRFDTLITSVEEHYSLLPDVNMILNSRLSYY